MRHIHAKDSPLRIAQLAAVLNGIKCGNNASVVHNGLGHAPLLTTIIRPHGLEQTLDFLLPKIDQWKRPAGGAGESRVEFEAEAFIDRGHDLCRLDGIFGRVRADGVTLADRAAALNTAAREIDAEALRPVIAS